MHKIKVCINRELKKYPVLIGAVDELLEKAIKSRKYSKIFCFIDANIAKKCNDIVSKLNQNLNVSCFSYKVNAGEDLKNLKKIDKIYAQLIHDGADRNSVLVAFGGGTVGDAIGFVSATYMRGVDWIGVPSTLLAQVDSSVGGKTGVNHPLGKNMVGAFYHPQFVICDQSFLETLSQREIVSGIGEILKYALAFDSKFFKFLEKNIEQLKTRNKKVLEKCIKASLSCKARIVSQDPYDKKGIREFLNLGHTFGHALESYTHYKKYQHGEAVLWGLHFAITLSLVKNKIQLKQYLEIKTILTKMEIPPLPRKLLFNDLLQYIKKDKKVMNQKIRFILLKNIGCAVSDHQVSIDDLKKTFSLFAKNFNHT